MMEYVDVYLKACIELFVRFIILRVFICSQLNLTFMLRGHFFHLRCVYLFRNICLLVYVVHKMLHKNAEIRIFGLPIITLVAPF